MNNTDQSSTYCLLLLFLILFLLYFCFCSFLIILKNCPWTRSMTGGPWTHSMKVVHGPGPRWGSMDPWSMFCPHPPQTVINNNVKNWNAQLSFVLHVTMAIQSLNPIIVRPQFNPKTIAFSIIYQIELVFWFKYQKMHFCHQDIVVYTVG